MRGKAEVRHERDQEPGITPACAGKRHCPRFRPGKTRDHPRVCGEKFPKWAPITLLMGSPPRMRGKDALCNDAESNRGITPAYAGKRWPDCRHQPQAGDHPRVCGEKVRSVSGRAASLGSPPRMRGKEMGTMKKALSDGITPACAGKRYIIGIDNGLI